MFLHLSKGMAKVHSFETSNDYQKLYHSIAIQWNNYSLLSHKITRAIHLHFFVNLRYTSMFCTFSIYTWTNLDQGLSFLLTTHFKGPIDQQMTSFCRILYDVCPEWFGAVTHKKDKTEEKRPKRRQIQKGKLRSEQRMLVHRLSTMQYA